MKKTNTPGQSQPGEDLQLNIEKVDGSKPIHIIHSEKEVLDEVAPLLIKAEGDIKTVKTFLEKRFPSASNKGVSLQEVDPNKAVIYVDRKKMTIELQLDPENKYGAIVKGEMEDADELKPFGINTATYFNREAMVKLVKFNKLFFDNTQKHAELIASLQKLDMDTKISSSDSSDDRGNKSRAFIKNVTSNLPENFTLNIPIFKGFDKRVFPVDICLDVIENKPAFWLESVALHELKQSELELIFKEQLAAAGEFVIVNQ